MIMWLKKYIESLFHVPLVAVGQRWQWVEFYKEAVNPFEPESGKRFIVTITDIIDGWVRYEYRDGSVGSDRVNKFYTGWVLLKDGEKE